MSSSSRWLEITEYLSLAALALGSGVAVASGKIVYVALPVFACVLLNLINRYRFAQKTRRRTNAVIKRMQQQLADDLQSLQKQVTETHARPSVAEQHGVSMEAREPVHALPPGISGEQSLDETVDLVPLYEHLIAQRQLIFSLQEQYVSWEESLSNIIDYLNSSSLPSRVDHVEKAIAQLSQELTRTIKQVEGIDRQLLAIAEKVSQPQVIAAPPDVASDVSITLDEAMEANAPTGVAIHPRSWNCTQTLSGHSDWVRSLAISSDGQILVSGSFDNTIKLWRLPQGEEIYTLSGHSKGVFAVAISPDREIVASGSWDQTIKLWQVDTGELSHTLNSHTGSVRSLAISPDGQTLFSGSFDGTIKLWGLPSGELIDTLVEEAAPIHAIALGTDAQILASGGESNTLKLWRLDTGEYLGGLTSYVNGFDSLAISPDSQILAAASVTGAIALWQLNFNQGDPRSGSPLCILEAHTKPVTCGIFSPDGETFISGSADGTIKIWHIENHSQLKGTLLSVLSDETMGAVISLAITHDGNTLAAGCADGTIKLWQPNL